MGGGRGVLLLQGYQNLAVHRPYGGGVAQGDIDAAIGQPDIVEQGLDLIVADDVADRALDAGKLALGFLNAGRGRRTYVQSHLSGIDLREKVLSQQGKQRERTNYQGAEKAEDNRRVRDTEA